MTSTGFSLETKVVILCVGGAMSCRRFAEFRKTLQELRKPAIFVSC